MVRGLDVFRRRFAGLEDRYVLIGGTAVDIAMDDAGLPFRATKDLDIVLHVESLDVEFARLFWAVPCIRRSRIVRTLRRTRTVGLRRWRAGSGAAARTTMRRAWQADASVSASSAWAGRNR